MHHLVHIGRATIALLLMGMMVMVCPCEPCGPGLLLQTETVVAATQQAALTGCCPGEEAAGDAKDGEHNCQHCDVDATLQASGDVQLSEALAIGPVPLPTWTSATVDTSTAWRPVVQPVVVRRANGPPPLLWAEPTSIRLAQLSVLRC